MEQYGRAPSECMRIIGLESHDGFGLRGEKEVDTKWSCR